MMSEIEDEVMVKPGNGSNTLKRVQMECTQHRSQLSEKQESCSLNASNSPLQDGFFDLSILTELALDAPDINHARVEHLKKEISSGSYYIASNQIAKRMLSNF